MHDVVAKQIAAGVDIGNNGEQQREAFFLYVRHRMSGFGGGWARRTFADVAHYPAFSAWKAAHDSVNESVSNTGGVPEAVGEVRYLDRAMVEAECKDFRGALNAAGGGFVEPFMTAPSPGIIAAAMRNAWYDTEDSYLDALGRALQVEYETIVAHGYLLQIDAPDLAMERHLSYQDKPLTDFVDFVEHVASPSVQSDNSLPYPDALVDPAAFPSFRPQSIQLMELTPASPETDSQSQLLRAPSCPAANLVRPNSSPSWSSGTPLDVRSSPSSSFSRLRRRSSSPPLSQQFYDPSLSLTAMQSRSV